MACPKSADTVHSHLLLQKTIHLSAECLTIQLTLLVSFRDTILPAHKRPQKQGQFDNAFALHPAIYNEIKLYFQGTFL